MTRNPTVVGLEIDPLDVIDRSLERRVTPRTATSRRSRRSSWTARSSTTAAVEDAAGNDTEAKGLI